MNLDIAQKMIAATLAYGAKANFMPLGVAVLDVRGALKAFAAADGTSLRRAELAIGKANGALALGLGTRAIAKMAVERPHFIAAATHAAGGSLVPTAGGVLIRDASGALLGAIGVSGDISDNDEAAALAGIAAVSLVGETG
jgi:uncharacterized protein GlcG (DUF336 family)